MLKEIKVLSDHGWQSIKDLRNQPVSSIFRGRPVISDDITENEVIRVSDLCPSGAISGDSGGIDLGRCVFCRECEFCLPGKIRFTNDYRIATSSMEALVIKPGSDIRVRFDSSLVRSEVRKLFKGALKLRQVSAGGDNSCEMELAASGNVNFDLGRYGIEFTASPRHADGIVITGPITENMAKALQMTYDAVPAPKIIILAGTDAISGGIFKESPAVNRQFLDRRHIDLYVPGNPIHPLTFINGIMDLLGIKP
ncbi:MAG: NADH:ubiquinone oxidoreductase [Bacteroidales bacterium]|nr:NADH:ubiquinone oxidoreductase [Bacteroidales bacterium]